MEKKDFIKQCRYYNGQDKNPNTDDELAWFGDMEHVYVNSGGKFTGETEYYKNIKGKEYKGIPFTLLMVMFTSWGKTAYSIKDEIGSFYKLIDDYLLIANDHYPENKIPNEQHTGKKPYLTKKTPNGQTSSKMGWNSFCMYNVKQR